MSTSMTRIHRTMIWPGIASVLLWILGLLIAGVSFVSVSGAARAASDGTSLPSGFLGLPLFEGFHADGRFGVHPQWGLLVLLIVPAVVGIALSLVALRRLPEHD